MPRVSKIKKQKFENLSDKMSIYYLDESSFEISQKMWRVLCPAWEKPRSQWKEKRHVTLSITWAYNMDWELVYRSSTSKKKEDFLEFLYQLRHKEKRKRIVLVLDNARIHHAKIIKKYCEEHNIKLVYLPPYSPELNPIEFLWKRIKRMYQKIQRKYDQIMKWVKIAVGKCRSKFEWYVLWEKLLLI